MAKINRKEYEILKNLKDEWKWIARDKTGKLFKFLAKPRKINDFSWDDRLETWSSMNDDYFQFIQWGDEEPYNIAELIKEYEFGRILLAMAEEEAVLELEYESEETEMKDNKLNRKTLDKILTEYFDERALSDDDAKIILDYHNFDGETLVELALGVVGLAWGTSGRKVVDILDDFDKLDEPESIEETTHLLESVLKENKRLGKLLEEKHEEWLELMDEIKNQEVFSEEWIDEKYFETENWDEDLFKSDGESIDHTPQIKVIAVQDLQKQNLLVPKQELPTIPKFVAEFLIGKEDYMLYELLDDEWLYKEHDRVAKWLYDNDELTNRQREIDLVMARDRGYKVEEEQKYMVRTNLGTYLILDTSKREWDYTSIPPQDDDIQYAYKFDDRSMAEGIAKLVEGEVEVLKE